MGANFFGRLASRNFFASFRWSGQSIPPKFFFQNESQALFKFVVELMLVPPWPIQKYVVTILRFTGKLDVVFEFEADAKNCA